MSRGPSRAAQAVSSAIVSLLLLFNFVVLAQQQQRHEGSLQEVILKDDFLQDQSSRPPEQNVVSPYRHGKDTFTSNSASAIATLAPAALESAVRAPPARFTAKSGISSLLDARSLQDWEVEDFVLLATVDGALHARNRKTGEPIWALVADRPMVETTYHRANQSRDGKYRVEDDFMWIVEPSRDGSLYIYHPGPNSGLQKLGMTLKKLVEELSPFAGEDPPVVYTAEKKTTLYTIDARSGKVLKWFSSGGSSVNDDSSCRRVSGLESLDEEECGSGGTLMLGRTEYTVGIQSRDTGDLICTLKYSEWGPNNRDSDLHSQYVTTMDNKYVYSRHDGFVIGREVGGKKNLYNQKLPSSVVRVFDIARPVERNTRDFPLVILPQPTPVDDAELLAHPDQRNGRVFVNTTESGGWYVMSEDTYPLVTSSANTAKVYDRGWSQSLPSWDEISYDQRQKALVGVHQLARYNSPKIPTISAPKDEPGNETPSDTKFIPPPLVSTTSIGNSRLIGYAAANIVDFAILTPIIIFFLFIWTNRRKLGKLLAKKLDVEKLPGVREALMTPPETPAVTSLGFPKDALENLPDGVENSDASGVDIAKEPEAPEAGSTTPTRTKSIDVTNVKSEGVRFEEPKPDDVERSPNQVKKRKTHRGNRGGVGRKKGKKEGSKEGDNGIDRIVDEVKEIGKESQAIDPDVVKTTINGAMPNDITDISGPFQINNLVVTDTVLGYGSHGTIVYRGSFEGKDVAVKRMLLEFFDVASHEVSLLQESDDHPNVIRYYCRQQSSGFLYIALELCPASLQDVVEKAHEYPALVSLMDPPNVLYQITAGVRHLHSLKIVHRDLKPQNILVAAPKIPRGRPDIVLPPRLLISDFGLCKKLDGDQSSFRATTAHAAGTSGWRAPELLVDDDNPNPTTPAISESAGSTSEPAIIDTLSNRRATRAIDIFSLGCVFFYVLSNGSHPFGDRYMREANIVRGHYNLDQLRVLGDYGHEAMDLISRMLDRNPRNRPDATTVMLHPFFWSPAKRLSFLVDASDHFEFEPRDPPSANLQLLEQDAHQVLGTDFLRRLDRAFVDTLGKQRKYTGTRMLDLLRALRNKKNHYEDMPDFVKSLVGPLPGGYFSYWATKFPYLLLHVYYVVVGCGWQDTPRFKSYFELPPIV